MYDLERQRSYAVTSYEIAHDITPSSAHDGRAPELR
jgi:hypothetical protein